jgi:hypothetical protein
MSHSNGEDTRFSILQKKTQIKKHEQKKARRLEKSTLGFSIRCQNVKVKQMDMESIFYLAP